MATKKLSPTDTGIMMGLMQAVLANTRAIKALTKRLNEQGLDTDAVSVTSLPERWNADPPEEA